MPRGRSGSRHRDRRQERPRERERDRDRDRDRGRERARSPQEQRKRRWSSDSREVRSKRSRQERGARPSRAERDSCGERDEQSRQRAEPPYRRPPPQPPAPDRPRQPPQPPAPDRPRQPPQPLAADRPREPPQPPAPDPAEPVLVCTHDLAQQEKAQYCGDTGQRHEAWIRRQDAKLKKAADELKRQQAAATWLQGGQAAPQQQPAAAKEHEVGALVEVGHLVLLVGEEVPKRLAKVKGQMGRVTEVVSAKEVKVRFNTLIGQPDKQGRIDGVRLCPLANLKRQADGPAQAPAQQAPPSVQAQRPAQQVPTPVQSQRPAQAPTPVQAPPPKAPPPKTPLPKAPLPKAPTPPVSVKRPPPPPPRPTAQKGAALPFPAAVRDTGFVPPPQPPKRSVKVPPQPRAAKAPTAPQRPAPAAAPPPSYAAAMAETTDLRLPNTGEKLGLHFAAGSMPLLLLQDCSADSPAARAGAESFRSRIICSIGDRPVWCQTDLLRELNENTSSTHVFNFLPLTTQAVRSHLGGGPFFRAMHQQKRGDPGAVWQAVRNYCRTYGLQDGWVDQAARDYLRWAKVQGGIDV